MATEINLPTNDGTGETLKGLGWIQGPNGYFRDRRKQGARYRIEIAHDYADVAARWEAMACDGGSTAFQRMTWLSAWFATYGKAAGVTPVLVTVTSEDGGQDIAAFPLVLRKSGLLRIIEPADFGITDYTGPIVSTRVPRTRADAGQMMRSLRRALPPCDLFIMRKMPSELGDLPNPVVLAGRTMGSEAQAHPIDIPGVVADWMETRSPRNREQSAKRWRAFQAMPGARYIRATSRQDVERLYSALVTLQAARKEKFDGRYILDDPLPRQFYDDLVRKGPSDGKVILTALEAHGQVVAVMLGIREGDYFGIPRLTIATGACDKLSPGVLLAEATINDLYAQGVRCFDFTIGDYEYKRRLRALPIALHDTYQPHSLSGLAVTIPIQLRHHLRRNPHLRALVQRAKAWAPAVEALLPRPSQWVGYGVQLIATLSTAALLVWSTRA